MSAPLPALPSRAPRPTRQSVLLGGLLFILALAHGALYAAITPPWQAPDEIAHFEYAVLLGQLRHPLWIENASPALEQAIIQSLYEYHAWAYMGLAAPATPPARLADVPFYGHSRTLTRFSLSYVLYAAAGLPFTGAGVIAQLYAMRAVSVILSALMVALTYQLARLVEPRAPALAWGSALFVLLLPQHAFITSAVSDGVLAELLATVTIYGVVRVWRDGATGRWLALIALSAVGALSSKTTAIFLVPLLGLGAVWGAGRWYTAPGRTPLERRRAALGLLVGVGAAVVVGPFILVWVNRLSSQLAEVTATLQATLGSADQWWAYVQRMWRGGEFTQAWAQTFESFWGYFGWMVVRLPAPWLLGLYGLTLLALGGWARRWAAERRFAVGRRFAAEQGITGEQDEKVEPKPGRLYQPLALAAGLVLLVLLTWFATTPVGLEFSQGRYLFGAMAPLAVLLVGGWLGWRPAREQGRLLVALLAVWVTFDTAALWQVLVPYFYRFGPGA